MPRAILLAAEPPAHYSSVQSVRIVASTAPDGECALLLTIGWSGDRFVCYDVLHINARQRFRK